MTELLVALGLIAGVVAAHEIGFWLGSVTNRLMSLSIDKWPWFGLPQLLSLLS